MRKDGLINALHRWYLDRGLSTETLEKHSFDVYVALPLRNGVSICFVRKALLTVPACGSERKCILAA